MKIAIYSRDASSDIVRVTIAYCQRWNCYPLIEQYIEREEILDAIKSESIDIAILKGNRQECDSIVEQTGKMGKQLHFIWLSVDDYPKTNHQQSTQKKQKYSSMLEEKIEKELESCGIPSTKESLCRVHLKVE
ncbi:hypothetical protein RBG61_07830 [Paludicola sp. MB14-C6]|uniref:hypothetical protein n=1 Tax=Paludihabitans sp. MB14-C6 TaxID=3070656 RepID=UPI0027DB90B3|nr:hypothetical protein [Paludicola sp. MB14-C6]WMJ21912.1 hypothetical protein RBG61_07830 [Paludicola sp. MB14-C6]